MRCREEQHHTWPVQHARYRLARDARLCVEGLSRVQSGQSSALGGIRVFDSYAVFGSVQPHEDLPMDDMSPTIPPLRLSLWLVVKALSVAALIAVAFSLADSRSEFLASAIVLPIALVGLIGRHGLRDGRSRLPAVVQGLCVGLFLGTAVGIGVFDGWSVATWAWAIPMVVLFPAVLPPRLQRIATARVETDEAAIERAGDRWTPNTSAR